MWTPWSRAADWTQNRTLNWGRSSNTTAVENARVAAVACSRARLERLEIDQYVEELAARRARPPISA
jgi:hypothetical protein